LVEQFGLRVSRDVRETDIISLQVVRRGLRPEPVAEGEALGSSIQGPSSYRGRGTTVSDLVVWLRSYSERPIIDDTGLDGKYDITIEWDPAAGNRGLQVAMRDAGFILLHARRRYAFLVVEQDS